MKIYSFPPLSNSDSKILILGTMPGNDSLKVNEYYAHSRNAFWKIMFAMFIQPFSDDYTIKKELLLNNQIALWNVLKACERKGSLDLNIKEEKANNLKSFFKKHRHISHIFFNGQKSTSFFFKSMQSNIPYTQLPSTSPIYTLPFQDKLNAWAIINQHLKSQSQ